ncbi:hypothetical protein ABG768_022216 [Culter alburnus]|uniref:Uncharacterized protein n=1 Tax=Culter alburnus TaxID=194366 RepID=A0AAW2ANG2_CULAL
MSGQKYATIPAIPPLVKGLLKSTQSSAYESAPLRAFQLIAVQQLQERLKREAAFSDRASNTVILATVLDPRFRKLKFLMSNMFKINCKQWHFKREGRWMCSSMAVAVLPPPILQLLNQHL